MAHTRLRVDLPFAPAKLYFALLTLELAAFALRLGLGDVFSNPFPALATVLAAAVVLVAHGLSAASERHGHAWLAVGVLFALVAVGEAIGIANLAASVLVLVAILATAILVGRERRKFPWLFATGAFFFAVAALLTQLDRADPYVTAAALLGWEPATTRATGALLTAFLGSYAMTCVLISLGSHLTRRELGRAAGGAVLVVTTLLAAVGGTGAGVLLWSRSASATIAAPVIGRGAQRANRQTSLPTVDPTALALEGFTIGMSMEQIPLAAEPLGLEFRGKQHDGGLLELVAMVEGTRLRSVKLLVADREVVAVRVRYTTGQSTALEAWQAQLPEPYFTDAQTLHFETESLQVKVRRDATRFYAARKEYRGRFVW